MKQPYGAWSPKAFKRLLSRYDLTPEQAADLLGATRRTGYNWLERGPPYAVALVFELMQRCDLTPSDLEQIGLQLTKKQPRFFPEI